MDFSALHVALSGLQAAQLGMDTTSHNIANASNPTYTRQRIEQRSHFPRTTPQGVIGLGVEVFDVTRSRDRFLDTRARLGSAAAAGLDVRSGLLTRAEDVFADPTGGLPARLSEVWDAFETLALDPPDQASRMQVISSLEEFAADVRNVAKSWEQTITDARASLVEAVDDVNRTLHQIADLNRSIAEGSAQPGSPNDLLDQRDALVDQLAATIGATGAPAGSLYRVSLNGLSLVEGTTVHELSVDTATAVVSNGTGVEVTAGGAIAGYQTFLQQDVVDLQRKLDVFVTTAADTLNAAHGGGYWSETDAGSGLFAYDPMRPAATLQVVIDDPQKLATAQDPGPPFPVFDGRNAAAMADLRHTPVGGETLEAALRGIIVGLGQVVASTSASSQGQAALHGSYEMARESVHGVSIDEEMVAMMQYQRAYEAAARTMTAVDEALDVLINRTGIVGR